MTALVERWAHVHDLLVRAAKELPPTSHPAVKGTRHAGPLSGTLPEFMEFLEHNEFGLALDTLVALGERTQPAPDFWSLVAQAAALMELPNPTPHGEPTLHG